MSTLIVPQSLKEITILSIIKRYSKPDANFGNLLQSPAFIPYNLPKELQRKIISMAVKYYYSLFISFLKKKRPLKRKIDDDNIVKNFHGYNLSNKKKNFQMLKIKPQFINFKSFNIIQFSYWLGPESLQVCDECYEILSNLELGYTFQFHGYETETTNANSCIYFYNNYCKLCFEKLYKFCDFTSATFLRLH